VPIEIHFRSPDGQVQVVSAEVGASIMETAVRQGVEGIIGQCGGSCACGTCHVRLAPADLDQFPDPDEMEDCMLDGVADGRSANSRLGCQLKLTERHHELVVLVPETQV